MFNTAIFEKAINDNLEIYFNVNDKDKIKDGLKQGNIILENLSIKESIMDKIQIPFTLKFSHIGKM